MALLPDSICASNSRPWSKWTNWLLLALTVCLAGCPSSERTPRETPDGSSAATDSEAQPDDPDESAIPVPRTDQITTIAPLAESPFLAADFRKEDPAVAGWKSEVFHQRTDAQLKKLGQLLIAGKFDPQSVSALADADFQTAGLRPLKLDSVFEDGATTVLRGGDQLEPPVRADLSQQLTMLLAPLKATSLRRFKFKTLRVEMNDGAAHTTADFQLSGKRAAGVVQINATWEITWTLESAPRIQSIHVRGYEEVHPGKHGRLSFIDVAPAVLGASDAYTAQLSTLR